MNNLDFFGKNVGREVICDDSLEWMDASSEKGVRFKAIVTSLPDMEEIGKDKDGWEKWIIDACTSIMRVLDDNGVVIFYQTDRKFKGEILDKKTLISNHFFENMYKSIFNKIVLKQKIETINLFRPGYTNMFGFSINAKSGKATPDVIECGQMIYKNAMGMRACSAAIEFITSVVDTDTIFDPFCGQGSVLKISNEMGYNSIGIDILPEQVEKAKSL